MSLHTDLDEAFSLLNCNRVADRKKALEKIMDLLNNDQVVIDLNEGNPFTWNALLETTQLCMRKECEKVAEHALKKGLSKTTERGLQLCTELFGLIVKLGIQNINISKLIRYIDGSLKETRMKMYKNCFVSTLKDYILPDPKCLGHFNADDFVLLLSLFKSIFEESGNEQIDYITIYRCMVLLIKNGPFSGLPPSCVREQFPFISKLCQSVSHNSPRSQQEHAVELLLDFCNHTVEDNRISCTKLGEDVLASLIDLYDVSRHDSQLKVNFIEFCLLQLIIHNPNGVTEGHSFAYAHNWHNWKACIRNIYFILNKEISDFLRNCVKNTLFFKPQGNGKTIILDSFASLFVEVTNQIIKDHDLANCSSSSLETSHLHKRKKVEASLISFIQEIHDTKSWVW